MAKVKAKAVDYGSYLKVKELTRLQAPLSEPPHHDEMLFIIIHQAYELWFKQILHELDSTIALVDEGRLRRACHSMNRVNAIMRLLIDQIHILETLEPVEFMQFRDRLAPASGFQSVQFRAIEATLGLTRYETLDRTLRASFFKALDGEIKVGGGDRVKQIAFLYADQDRHLDLYHLAECCITTDQLLSLWRDHHVSVVERIIGRKRGTGGSEGVEYLRTTLPHRCFQELWDARTFMSVDS